MTETIQVNDVAVMIYHGGFLVLKKYQSPDFCHYFYYNHMKGMQMQKEIVLLLKPMTKTSQPNVVARKSKEDVLRRVLSPKWPFKMAA